MTNNKPFKGPLIGPLKRHLTALLTGAISAVLGLVSAPALADWQLNMPKGVTDISHRVFEMHMLAFWIMCLVACGGFWRHVLEHIASPQVERRNPGDVP